MRTTRDISEDRGIIEIKWNNAAVTIKNDANKERH